MTDVYLFESLLHEKVIVKINKKMFKSVSNS